ncbi:MAG: OsmC family peroxiredoxin [Hydrogenophaga sp.]|uniref:OsmC family protein n=1 Tax=Hydrogenophaga sp. TaxID=1904254 RepID=UPI0016A0E384|nr:OsmC family protein [Hydrogenophaga sp.]NIM39652.1 OsmC family peroxiredoxin [Hydrogenophaga sp.]NIN24856.1 OsmC family peroxiredoxin [Hydrogenophaga sp.]NIN29368.1 OsmC family peroxiredoxin [Hydrogenophaga sp.]NIN53891.1 OsmC family peroxiredoxin [Hydrogenophaga sp.]NIO50095.1 OsmC family peroxiredoxin [Hydrogenophaga sp.]
MSAAHIRQSVEELAKHFADNPQDAISRDKPAVATVESGLRCKAVGPKGEVLITDMPAPIGGGGSAPTPGWYLRAALANCDATMIALRAAQLGIELSQLEVTVGSRSDNRGLLGAGDGEAHAGPLDVQLTVRIAAPGVPAQTLHELVQWAEAHSPVGDALRRALTVRAEVQVA